MGQTAYDDLTLEQKQTLFVGPGALAFPHNDPNNAVDYAGLSGTLTLPQYIDIVNNSTIPLYFKIVTTVLSGDESKWSNLTVQVGQVSSGGKLAYKWQPTRIVPTSKVTEYLRVNLKAYKDAGYSNLYGEDYTDYSYQFFDHSTGTIIAWDDFETSFDWYHPGAFAERYNGYAYTGSWSVRLGFVFWGAYSNCQADASGQEIPNQTYYISKTFNLAGYSSAYLVLHSTYHNQETTGGRPNVFRIWTSTKDYIIRIPRTAGTFQPYRIAVPLPCVNDTVYITEGAKSEGSNTWNGFIDTVIVVAFT